jgi:hypothetical protein
MINGSVLRIGNAIVVDGVVNRVESLKNKFLNRLEGSKSPLLVGLDIFPDVWSDSNRVQPYNVSVKLLLELGFKEVDDEGDCKYFEKGRYGIKSNGNEFYLYHNSDPYITLTEIKYIHHLQNLFFDLDGIDLSFKH